MEFKDLSLFENEYVKSCKSSDYNYTFHKKTGFFARWGKTEEDDPQWGPAPEILDLEISTSSKCSGKCKFCYKKNSDGQIDHNMTFDEFKKILDKMPKTNTKLYKITLDNGEVLKAYSNSVVMTCEGIKPVCLLEENDEIVPFEEGVWVKMLNIDSKGDIQYEKTDSTNCGKQTG